MKALFSIIGVLIALVLVGLVAAFLYFRSGAAFGIDEKHPLGQLDKVETYLVSAGLEKNESALNSIRELFGGSKVLYYVQPVPKDSDAEADGITVVADDEGVIHQVTCAFRRGTGKNAFDSKVKVIATLYWTTTGGGNHPDFGSADPKTKPVKEFVKDGVRGTWTRDAEFDEVSLKTR